MTTHLLSCFPECLRAALGFALLSAISVTGGRAATAAPAHPDAATVLAQMRHAADWQLANPGRQKPTDWVQGAFYTGLMALAEISPDPRYRDAMRRIGEANHWELGPLTYDADDQCVGQAYAELYLQDHDPRMIAPMRARFDTILAHPKDDDLDFDPVKNPGRRERWSWCDSLFMAPPAWVRLSAATGDARYRDFAVKKWWVTSDYLYDPTEQLFFRDSTFFHKHEANGKKVFWSRGNGWVIAGLARVLEFLPADDPARPRFEQQFRDMATRLLGLQQPDGLWRASLLDPEAFPQKETSGSGFFCFALAWGINHHLLDAATFTPAVWRAWEALNQCVDADGRLTHVQTIAGSPKGFPPDATMPYGVGAFLLAGREVHRLAKAPQR
ncbi:MAG TPA: glycoside hydrolase family 88 protein [Opitutaceae bacterium]|nr:glycoside hydrolase family 88 protein [Opitutaceae bacterium]